MSSIRINLDELAAAYNSALPKFDPEEQRISIQVYRLLAKGRPVSRESLAESLNYHINKVNAILDNWFGVYFDDDKNIIGYWGLALQEMPHRFEVEGKTLYTWCAWDSLFIPELIRKAAHVVSTDPISKDKIRLTVTPDGIAELNPPGAVMSHVKPEATIIDENVIQGFCHYIFFFTSAETGSKWTSQHKNTSVISIEDAFLLAKRKNKFQYPKFITTA